MSSCTVTEFVYEPLSCQTKFFVTSEGFLYANGCSIELTHSGFVQIRHLPFMQELLVSWSGNVQRNSLASFPSPKAMTLYATCTGKGSMNSRIVLVHPETCGIPRHSEKRFLQQHFSTAVNKYPHYIKS